MWKIVILLCLIISLPLAAAEKITVALVGSSACEDYGITNPDQIWGWGSVIGHYFKPEVHITNHAKGGRSTKSFIAEGRWDKVLAEKPDFILMTLGANDTKGKPHATDPETEFRGNLKKFAGDADKAGIQIIFVTLNTSMHFSQDKTRAVFSKSGKAVRSDRLKHCQAIREVAAELNKPCLELFNNQVLLWEKMGEEKAATLYRITPQGKIDPSHTNKAGAELIAGIIAKELSESSSPLAAYVDTSKL